MGALNRYSVVVGNIGQVYDGSNYRKASDTFRNYVTLSRAPAGRAAGEDVILFQNDRLYTQHLGHHHEQPKEAGAEDNRSTQPGSGKET